MKKKTPYQRIKERGEAYRINSDEGETYTEYTKRVRKLKRLGL